MKCSRLPPLGLLLLTLSSAGCATAPSSACAPVVAYDQATRDRAAAELTGLGPTSVLSRMMADYAVLRDQARACAHG